MPTERTLVIAPEVADADYVHAAVTLTTVPQTVTTAITDPDVDRVVSITGNAAGIAGNVTIAGTDAMGDDATDIIALNGAATVLGVVAFATVTSIILPARTQADDTVSVGIGDVFGLTGHISLTSDVTSAERMATGETTYTAEAVGTVDVDNATVTAVIVAGDTMRWTYYDRGVGGAIVDELREMVAESTTDTWTDADLTLVIERYALIDADGYEPDESDWTPTYDLNAAAANIWGRKAASLATMYDFKADGGDFKRSQLYKNARSEERKYKARSMPSSLRMQKPRNFERDYQSTYWDDQPKTLDDSYVANALPADEDE